MARKSFGKGIGSASVEKIGDNRYGLIEQYDSSVFSKTIKYYQEGEKPALSFKIVNNPLKTKVYNKKV